MDRKIYLEALDRALLFAAAHTDAAGRMVVDGEIDTKDSGWLVLGGVIRGCEAGWRIGGCDLAALCRSWTLASIRVDDAKSAWTTFALLLADEFSGGKFSALLSEDERGELKRFFNQIDMKFLLEASRNYRVAAAVIDTLEVRRSWRERPSVDPLECIDWMLAGYLGDGFFNDDDGRGDSRDRRIDAYSAEIIGLLLHYDEIHGWNSPRHDRIMEIVREFCAAALPLIDADGEFAKWGRSLRGEAEVKKIFLWEFAATHGLVDPGDGEAAARRQFGSFLALGIGADGRIGRDKAHDAGIWDEYTTHVQAQGYGVYGLAMALRFASGSRDANFLPSESRDYVQFLPGPAILCGSDRRTKMHYILPAGNRLTKNMFFWHNRITGENDVDVDVSAKFMPLPYFGHCLPAPYAGPTVPFLPMVLLPDGRRLVPRNLDPALEIDANRVVRNFAFCEAAKYVPACSGAFRGEIGCFFDHLDFDFVFSGEFPEGAQLGIYLFKPADRGIRLDAVFSPLPGSQEEVTAEPSIYGKTTAAALYRFAPAARITFSLKWRCADDEK